MAQMGDLVIDLFWQLRHWGVAAVLFIISARYWQPTFQKGQARRLGFWEGQTSNS